MKTSLSEIPLSIITISKSGRDATLQLTRESLQDLASAVEWIVVVGDEAASVEFASQLLNPNQVIGGSSEGIYSAMNAGLSSATRDYVYFLNAGDLLVGPHDLIRMVSDLAESRLPWSVASVRINGVGKVLDGPNILARKTLCAFADGSMPPQPATVYCRRTLFGLGGFNESLSIAADYEMALRFTQIAQPLGSSGVVSLMEPGGISATNRFAALREMRLVRRRVSQDNGYRWRRERVAMCALKAYVLAIHSVASRNICRLRRKVKVRITV